MSKKKYTIVGIQDCHYTTEIEANSEEEAIKLAENNTVKFDMQNGKFETIAFARDNHTAIEIASALNLLENEGDKC